MGSQRVRRDLATKQQQLGKQDETSVGGGRVKVTNILKVILIGIFCKPAWYVKTSDK